jgi:antitoxin component HigA of HigAB toxin-antitoxin module
MKTQFYTIALFVVAGGMTFIAGLMGYLYRQRDDEYEQAAKRVNELTTKREREELLTKRLADNISKMSRQVTEGQHAYREQQQMIELLQQEIDTLRSTVKQYEDWCNEKQQAIDLLKAERATLYRRNEKGQIVPITPKPRKPHTLKHGMTVKDPTPKQAERIFREAKRAGILSAKAEMPSNRFPYILFAVNGIVTDCIAMECGNETYITASEFVKRIKGEVA